MRNSKRKQQQKENLYSKSGNQLKFLEQIMINRFCKTKHSSRHIESKRENTLMCLCEWKAVRGERALAKGETLLSVTICRTL